MTIALAKYPLFKLPRPSPAPARRRRARAGDAPPGHAARRRRSARREARDLLDARAARTSEITLGAGAQSNFCFDCKPVTSSADGSCPGGMAAPDVRGPSCDLPVARPTRLTARLLGRGQDDALDGEESLVDLAERDLDVAQPFVEPVQARLDTVDSGVHAGDLRRQVGSQVVEAGPRPPIPIPRSRQLARPPATSIAARLRGSSQGHSARALPHEAARGDDGAADVAPSRRERPTPFATPRADRPGRPPPTAPIAASQPGRESTPFGGADSWPRQSAGARRAEARRGPAERGPARGP